MKNIYDYFLKNEAKILANHMRTEGSTVSINDLKKLISTKVENKVMEEALGVTPTDFNMFYNLEDGWSYVFEIEQQYIDLELITRINSKVSDETNAFQASLEPSKVYSFQHKKIIIFQIYRCLKL